MDQTYPAPTGSREHRELESEFSMEYDDRATLPNNFLAGQFLDGSYSQVPSSDLTSPNLDLDPFTWDYHLRDDANSMGGCPGLSSMPSYPLPGPQSDITDTERAISDMAMPPEMNQSTSYSPATFGQAPSWMQTDGQFATAASDQYLRDFRTTNEDLRIGFVLERELAVPQFACKNGTVAAASEETGTLASTWMTDLETQRTMGNGRRPSTRDTEIQSGPTLSAPASRAMTSQLTEVADQQPSQFRFALERLEIGAESTWSRAQTLPDELEPSGGPIALNPFANLHDTDLGEQNPVSSTVLSTTTSAPVSPTTYLTSPQTEPTNDYRARNRVAASRCRYRQKSTITGLKEAERNMLDERDRLLDMKRSLTDQVCCLKEQLFMHANCKEDRLIGEYLELTANRIVDKAREAAAEQQTSPILGSSASGSAFDYVGAFEDDG